MVTVVMLLVPVIVSIAIVISDILRCVLEFVVVAGSVGVVVSNVYCYCNHYPYCCRYWCDDCCVYSCFLLVASTTVLCVFLLALIVVFLYSLFFLRLSFMVLMFLLFLLLLFFVQDGCYLPYTYRMSNSFYETHRIFKEKSKLTTSAIRHCRSRLTYTSSTCFDGRSATGGLPCREQEKMSHKETLKL